MTLKSQIRNRKSAMPLVGILDYGMGNLRSVAKSFEAAGARVFVSDSSRHLSKAELLVVPGVGAFGDAMRALRAKKLDRFIRSWVDGGHPYFGICLGMQVLFERSEESPGVKGLGVMRGSVRRFRIDPKLKVPHMGWNVIAPGPEVGKGHGSPLGRFSSKEYFYFVHSYFPEPEEKAVVWLQTVHGKKFCSAVARGTLLATQFHPEKSGDAGQRFLREVLRRLPAAA